MVSLYHAAEHPFTPGQDHADRHHRQKKEYQTEEWGQQSASKPPLFVVLQAFCQKFRSGYVQGEVCLRSTSRLKREKKLFKTTQEKCI